MWKPISDARPTPGQDFVVLFGSRRDGDMAVAHYDAHSGQWMQHGAYLWNVTHFLDGTSPRPPRVIPPFRDAPNTRRHGRQRKT